MKKILVSILIIGLLVLASVAMYKGLNMGSIKISSIGNIKKQNLKLNQDLDEANELSNKTYITSVEDLENAIKQLKISKQEYENKKLYSKEEEALGTLEIKTYTLHYLWTILGNYRKDRGVRSLNLALKSTANENVYDLDFTLIGTYINITDFLYDIEDDKELNFEIKNFQITSDLTDETETKDEKKDEKKSGSPALPQQSTNKVDGGKGPKQKNNSTLAKYKDDGTILKATFTVKNIGITLE